MLSNEFLVYILDQFSAWDGVTARRMFGGSGLFRGGKMFGLVADDVAYLKVDESNRDKFVMAGSSPFKPFPARPAVLSYYEIPPEIMEDAEALIEWAGESLSIQKKRK